MKNIHGYDYSQDFELLSANIRTFNAVKRKWLARRAIRQILGQLADCAAQFPNRLVNLPIGQIGRLDEPLAQG